MAGKYGIHGSKGYIIWSRGRLLQVKKLETNRKATEKEKC